MGIMNLLKRFKKKHPDIDRIAGELAKQYGVSKSDIIAAAVTAYANAAGDENMREQLAHVIAGRKSNTVSEMNVLKDAIIMFKDVFEAVADVMAKSQETALKVAKNSIIQELKSNVETIEEIKKLGSTAGKGSMTDIIAESFIRNILSNIGVKTNTGKSESKKKYNIEELNE